MWSEYKDSELKLTQVVLHGFRAPPVEKGSGMFMFTNLF